MTSQPCHQSTPVQLQANRARHTYFSALYPDDTLYAFASLNNASCSAPSSEDGPRADFAAFVEWTLARNKPSFTACSLENFASATPDPEPSQPPPRHAEHEPEPEPTADGSHATSVTQEPSPIGATEQAVATELEEFASDQVREPATIPATVVVSAERESAENSITHCTTTEGEQDLELGEFKMDAPQLTICAVGSPRVCQSPSVSWLEDPSSSPPASESWTPPWPSDPAAPPRLSAPSISTVARQSTSCTGLHRPSGSALVSRRPTFASGLYSSGCASSLRPSGSVDLLPPTGTASVLCRSGPAADLRISVSALVARALGSAWVLRILGVAKDHRLAVSASGSTTACSASVGRPHGVVSLSSTMAPPSIGSIVGFHHGCGLGLTWLLLLQPPPVTSLAPPSVITSMDYSVITLDSRFCPPPGSPSSA
ncbi:Obscurin [Labeo rohita]|uniref:Obscurin n=1 Tax=Labeo rohita TaxID=84645 RepID=A0ABQ8L5Q7_LABRO|nr:Obscurin [Labeo rohita]